MRRENQLRFAHGQAEHSKQPCGQKAQSARLGDRTDAGSSGALPRDEAQIKSAGVRARTFPGFGGKFDGRWRVHTRVMGVVVAEGETRPVAVAPGARAEERRRATIDLTGAIITCAASVDEGKAADGIGYHEFLRAAHETDAAAEKSAQIVGRAAIAKTSTYAAGARSGALDFDDVRACA